jgi:heparin binding hemagglutinin HbhA
MSVIDTVKNALPAVKLPEVKLPEVKLPELAAGLPTSATKSAHAVVGAGDLAVEQAREQLKSLQTSLPTLPKKAQARATEAQTKVVEYVTTVPAKLAELKGKANVAELKTVASGYADKATALYNELAARGEKVVATIRKQPATKAAEKAGKQAVRSAKGTATSAKKAVKATTEAVADAADTIG